MSTIHAAAVAVDGKAYLFSAPCGGGKSTHVIEWKKYFGQDAEIINGDFPMLTIEKDRVWVSGTPWCGKERLQCNKTVPVAGIAFVEKSQNNAIRVLNTSDVLKKIFFQLIMPDDKYNCMQDYITFADRLIKTVQFYELKCNISEQAVITAYNYMKQEDIRK